jgi:putative transposase
MQSLPGLHLAWGSDHAYAFATPSELLVYRSTRYLLTICANEKKPLFRNRELVEVIRSHILIAAKASGFDIIAYCFMPDHVHLVIEGSTESASLSTFVQRAKQLSGYYGKRMVGGSVWQTGYHERVLRADQDTPSVVAYVLANPVRAGFVDNRQTTRLAARECGHSRSCWITSRTKLARAKARAYMYGRWLSAPS